jgi:hypothetical protein
MPNIKFKPILLIPILFFLIIFLSAFAKQPATTSSSAPTPTPTSIYAIPRLQLPDVDPLPITTPDAPADQYTLANWDTETVKLALANFQIDDDLPNEQPIIFLTLLEEAYLQYPELDQDKSFLRELAIIRDITAFPNMQFIIYDTLSSLPIYTQILEDALNQGKLQPENVEEWIYNNMAVLNVDTIRTSNLFSDENPVWVYNIIKFDGYWQITLFVTQNEEGIFTVSIFSDDNWENMHRWNYELRIQDLNNNGIPEIIRDRLSWWHYGIEDLEKDISIYEWNNGNYLPLLPDNPFIHIFRKETEDDLNVWMFEDQPDGSKMIIGKQTTPTTEKCPPYIEYENYFWTGHSFEFDHIDVEPLPDNTSEECKVIWTLAAGQRNPDTIPVIKNALSNWPVSLEDEFGPAAKDYLALWMAEAAALQGDTHLALDTLDALIQNPYNPEYSAVTKMAQAYKNTYQNKGPYLACLSVDRWKSTDKIRLNNYNTSFSEEFLQTLVNHWGFSDVNYASAYPCDPQTTFEAWMQNQTFATKSQLIRWLYENGVQWIGLRQMDINNDGRMDWLVITHLLNNDNMKLWAILQLEDRILPIEINTSFENIETLTISINQYFPPDHGNPVQVYQMGNQVVAFQTIERNGQYYPFIQFTAGTTENPTRGVEIKDDILTIYFKHGMSQYQWHDQPQRFELLQSTADESDSPSLEELLFVEQNPQAVINELEAWFKSINPATENSWESYYIENTLPYRTYLLGLAYELNGQDQKAIQTYYNLWQTYPENPFTTIARYKLEKME